MGPAYERDAEKITQNFRLQRVRPQQGKSLNFYFEKAAITIQHWFLKSREIDSLFSSGS